MLHRILFIMFIAILGLAGCDSGSSNRVVVSQGMPFTASADFQYGIKEGGPVYTNIQPPPGTIVVHVDPYTYHYLTPGRSYVMYMNPDYYAREADEEDEDEAFQGAMDSMKAWGHSCDRFGRSDRRTMHNTERSVRGTDRANRQTMGTLNNAQRQQNNINRQKAADVKRAYGK